MPTMDYCLSYKLPRTFSSRELKLMDDWQNVQTDQMLCIVASDVGLLFASNYTDPDTVLFSTEKCQHAFLISPRKNIVYIN